MVKEFDKYPILKDEPIEKYIYRLSHSRESEKLTWQDVADIVANVVGQTHSEAWYRKRYNRIKDDETPELKIYSSELPKNPQLGDVYSEKLKIVREERIRLHDERVANNALIRQIDRDAIWQDIANDCVEKLISHYKPIDFDSKLVDIGENVGVLQISDWHYGMEHHSYFNDYNSDICRERVASLYNQVVDAAYNNNIKTIYIANIGDMISGYIHSQIRIENREDVAQQTIDVAEILIEFIDKLQEDFNVVYGDCAGNHDRMTPDMHESVRIESFSRIIHHMIKRAFKDSERVTILENTIRDDIITFEILGTKFACVHGDNKKDKPNTIIPKITSWTHEFFDVYLSGHLHSFAARDENNQTLFINGSLSGVDDYAESGRYNNVPSQNFFVVSKDNPTKAIYRMLL